MLRGFPFLSRIFRIQLSLIFLLGAQVLFSPNSFGSCGYYYSTCESACAPGGGTGECNPTASCLPGCNSCPYGYTTGSGNGLQVCAGTHHYEITNCDCIATPPPGVCGGANGSPVYTAPASGLCTTGPTGPVTGTGPWNWTCGTGAGSVPCSANKKIDGACGPINGSSSYTAPSSGLCAGGSSSPVTGSGPWNWNCVGIFSAVTVPCSVNLKADGVCGASNGTSGTTAPTSGLCLVGPASPVTGSGPWNWSCGGSNGGATVPCSEALTAVTVNGVCGAANGRADLITAPTSATDLCSSGTSPAPSGPGPSWSWLCSGSGPGATNMSCSASMITTTTIIDDKNQLDFFDVRTFTTSNPNSNTRDKMVTFTNNGFIPATFCSLSAPGANFTYNQAACPSTLNPSATCQVTVNGGSAAFSTVPTVPNGTLILTCGNTIPGSLSVTLTETGITWPTLAFADATHFFPNVSDTNAVTFTEHINNTGTVDAKDCNIIPGGTNFGYFTITANTCGLVGKNSSCSFDITAKAPPGFGASVYKADFTIKCKDTSSTNYNSDAYTDITAQTTPDGYTFAGAVCPGNATVVAGVCHCPAGYEIQGLYCKPKLPSNDYYRTDLVTGDPVLDQGFPVCNPNVGLALQNLRMPVSAGFQYSSASSIYLPRSRTKTTTYPTTTGSPYPYSTSKVAGNEIVPDYHYSSLSHCACLGQSILGGDIFPADPVLTQLYASGNGGDTLDFISSHDTNGFPNKPYSMVSFSADPTINGAAVYPDPAVFIGCGCPNLNEYPALIASANTVKGVRCLPAVAPANRVFALYDPLVDNIGGKSQVFTAAAINGLPNMIAGNYTEPLAGGAIPTSVGLVSSAADSGVVSSYARHIWKCQIGYTLDTTVTPAVCKWNADHACNANSPMGKDINNNPLAFASTVNKKLACCMNNEDGNTKSTIDVKFDCIDNSKTNIANFDALWSSVDAAADGGEMNAVILAAGNGKPLTGFYTTDGARCNELSEFDPKGIQPGILNPAAANTSSQQALANGKSGEEFQAVGAPIVAPVGTGYDQLTAGFPRAMVAPQPAKGNAVENAKARRCPILVRAAMVATCPVPVPTPVPPAVTNSILYTQTIAGVTRCPAAATVQFHIRAEQVYEITGTPRMITVDTIIDKKDLGALSTDEILRRKNGSACLPGMVANGGGCHY